jgi:subtilisin family serine protease
MSRRFSLVLVLVLLAALVGPAAVSAEVVVTDGPRPTGDRYSHRLIVELTSLPLAAASAVAGLEAGGKLDVASPAAQAYIQRLQAEQQQFVAALQAVAPNARVASVLNGQGGSSPATYQILLNGLAIEAAPDADLDALERELRGLPNVKRVSRDWAHTPDLYKSLDLINAPAAWNHPAIGGENNAGKGIKVASIDGGVHKDAPMFSGTGYTYPPGYPKGDPSGTNGKIIVARAYFRTWDPPAPGDENVWPGEAGTSHGTHTASIAAGNKVQASFLGADPVTISGVAPKAYVMSYRVFYESVTGDGSFYNAEGIKALEDAVADGADVINNSWGGGPYSLGGQYDALDQALLNAVNAGVFVTMSAGNAGPGAATSDHPSTDYIVVAASTSGGSYAAGRLDAAAPEPVPAELKGFPYQAAAFGGPIPLGQLLPPRPYAAAAIVDPANATGCNPFPAGVFAGKAALIIRGVCEFGVKALNAQNAGAEMFIVYNHATGGDTLIPMGPGDVGEQVTIPGVFVGNTAGTALMNWNAANPTTAQLRLNTIAFQVGNEPDVIADFSSRGPSVGNGLKPDITAPGVNILAQGYAPGTTGEDRHLGFGEVSGTSMAAPHVTGSGALLKQIHPTWTPGWIKSALMSTSKYTDIYLENGDPAQPLQMGAGRLDVGKAVDPGVILDPPSLSFGRVTMGGSATMTVTVRSVAGTAQTYAISTVDTRDGFTATTTLDGVTVTPASLTLAPNATGQVTVSWDTTETSGPGDQQGFVVLKSGGYEAHFPVWVRVGYAPDPNVGDVLLIDNDGSTSMEDPAYPDYTRYYTETLEALGVTYDVWDADAQAGNSMSLPDANYLAQYKAVIYQTGNYDLPDATFTVPTPLTQLDMDALTEYANDGGPVIAFGQNLAQVTQGDSSDASFFFGTTLGAEWLQSSINAGQVFTQTPQLLTGVPEGPYHNMNFDISARGDGAKNQESVDELSPSCFDPDDPNACVGFLPLIRYGMRGKDIEQGYVALARSERATLERPQVISNNQTMIFGFGLEGVNNNTGFDTREELLGTALHWVWDEPEVTITVDNQGPGRVTTFTVDMESEFGGEGVTYRWDFGDGTEFTPIYESDTVGHTYAKPGRYVVRVEATNEFGTTVITERVVTIGIPLFAPMIMR